MSSLLAPFHVYVFHLFLCFSVLKSLRTNRNIDTKWVNVSAKLCLTCVGVQVFTDLFSSMRTDSKILTLYGEERSAKTRILVYFPQ